MGVGKVEPGGGSEPGRARAAREKSTTPFPRPGEKRKPPPPKAAAPAAPAPVPGVRPEHVRFAQNMVHAADVACVPGPTTDGDMLPRESVSGLFLKAHVIEEGEALGRGPVDRDEAARLAIEHHSRGRSGRYYDAVVEEDGEDAFRIRLHPLDPNPPFLPADEPEAIYRVLRRGGRIEPL